MTSLQEVDPYTGLQYRLQSYWQKLPFQLFLVGCIRAGSAQIVKLLSSKFRDARSHLHNVINRTRAVTICLDEWSKKNLTSSYLAISGCLYDPETNTALHFLLDLYELPHPHTGCYFVFVFILLFVVLYLNTDFNV